MKNSSNNPFSELKTGDVLRQVIINTEEGPLSFSFAQVLSVTNSWLSFVSSEGTTVIGSDDSFTLKIN